MYRLFESIKLVNGEFQNLEFHLKRIEESSIDLFGFRRDVDLEKSLRTVARPTQGLYKARLQYNEEQETIGYSPYQMRQVSSFKLVMSDTIDYSHKFCDRSQLDFLFSMRGQCDDVIIVKKRLITDSSYANLAFKKNGRWYTPASYLLKGTMRSSLMQNGVITEEEIGVDNLKNFEKVKLINSMVGFEGPEIDINKIED